MWLNMLLISLCIGFAAFLGIHGAIQIEKNKAEKKELSDSLDKNGNKKS